MGDGHTLPLSSSEALDAEEAANEEQIEQRLRKALADEYELGPKIGQGGMGIVYRATDRRLMREVAIKVLPPELAQRSDLRKRFVREAQLAASLTHPHIVSIYDVGHRDGLAWFVMAYIHGETVRDYVRRQGAQPVHVAVRVLREIAWALSYAHARGIIHRDVKPDNIMIERASGRAVVMDFGLAKIDSDDEHLTQPGKVLGTPAYMSPEQARGKEAIDQRTDIYSLGLVGYHMLSGRSPFDASNAQTVMARIMTEEAPSIATTRPDVPTWLADALKKATARQPSKRYKQAEQLAEALDHGQTIHEIPTSVLSLLDLLESYVQVSVLGAWMLFIVGLPKLPNGTGLIFAALVFSPLLTVLQLINAEGLTWADIREGIVARRIHWLRSLSLKREVGVHLPSVIVLVLTIVGVLAIRWSGTILSFATIFFGERKQWISLDPGPAGTGEFLFQGPRWALWYAIFGSLVWTRLFGLPIARRLSPQRLDAVASWRMPRWMDLLGELLFKRVGSYGRVIEATADFRQLTEPAVREAVAFNRTKRNLRYLDRWRLRRPISLGKLVVKRLWLNQEVVRNIRQRIREEQRTNPSGTPPEALARELDGRETLLAECAASLGGLRSLLEEASSPHDDEDVHDDQPIVEELLRLTSTMRRVRLVSRIGVISWLILLIVWVFLLGGKHLAVGIVGNILLYSLPFLLLLQLLKPKLYSLIGLDKNEESQTLLADGQEGDMVKPP